MRSTGTVRRWDAARGFGFIQGAHSSQVFFHVRDFRGASPPAEGLQVSYEEIQVGGKGPRAMDVRLAAEPAAATALGSATPRARAQPTSGHARAARCARSPAPRGTGLAHLLMAGWLALLAWGAWAGRLPAWLLLAAAALNALTYLVYARDKRAARDGTWRTSERTLHLLALLGGWPAAWWAQQRLRHKSSKTEFRVVYWLTVVLHCAALTFVVTQPVLLARLLARVAA